MSAPFEFSFPSLVTSGDIDDEKESTELQKCNFSFGLQDLLSQNSDKVSEPRPAYHQPVFPTLEEQVVHYDKEEESEDEEEDEDGGINKFEESFKFDVVADIQPAPVVISSTDNAKYWERGVELRAEERVKMEAVWGDQFAWRMPEAPRSQTCRLLKCRALSSGPPLSIVYTGVRGAVFLLDPASKTVLSQTSFVGVMEVDDLPAGTRYEAEKELSLWELCFLFEHHLIRSDFQGVGPTFDAVQRLCAIEPLNPLQMIRLAYEASELSPKTVKVRNRLSFSFVVVFSSLFNRACCCNLW